LKRLLKYEWIAWVLVALLYYVSLACFRYTWVFEGGDAGDWLAASKLWIVPHPYGSPLYISLGHFINLFTNNLEGHMTFWLSCLTSAFTIGIIYQASKNLTGKAYLGRIAALICLGAGVLTSQSLILEEYAIVIMFLSAAILAYSASRNNWAVVFMGLGLAIHIIMLPIAVIFFIAHYKTWKYWVKRVPLFLIFGVLPYGLIVYLVWSGAPQYISSDFTWLGWDAYLSGTTTVGSLSIISAPQRILMVIGFILGTFGLAIIPAVRYGWKNRKLPIVLALTLTLFFIQWLYLTNIDFTTWTFTIFAVPCVAILAALGLKKAHRFEHIIVTLMAIILIIINAGLLNAKKLDAAKPIGTNFYNETMSLPEGSIVLTSKGGFFLLGLLHCIADGKDIIPVYLSEKGTDVHYGYQSWVKWANKQYGLIGNNSEQMVENSDRPIFFIESWTYRDWSEVYEFETYGEYYKQVIGIK
jgi:hypothetical protein